jgi:prepilin-type N-terminal cleavage/methylation domain-containing protein
MSRKRAFTLVELLVVIAIIAVLLAILLPALKNVKALGKRLQCSWRLKSIGTAWIMYGEKYDGKLPRPENVDDETKDPTNVHYNRHYYVVNRDSPKGSGLLGPWMNLGCLFGARLIEDGRSFYCPATEGWLEEYKSYCDPTPWGTLPQKRNTPPIGNGNQWIRVDNGYIYAPQSKEVVKNGNPGLAYPEVYTIGRPEFAVTVKTVNQGKAFAADYTFHAVKGSGWSGSAVFPDGHVSFGPAPKAGGKSLYYSLNQFPDEAKTDMVAFNASWQQTSLAEYMFALQP